MLTVSQADLADALDVTRNTVTARTCSLPYTTGSLGQRRYRLGDVLPTLRERERVFVPILFDLADGGEELFVGDDAIHRARRLEAWLQGEQRERLFCAQVSFTTALVSSVQSSVLFEHIDALRLRLALHDDILRWTVLADAKALPPFEHFALPFAITNARYETIFDKEAA
ncbi:hypothetical protein PVW53_06625 [Seohaeicola sp. SP36]|uniref:hypothetical protein n=1 Tax=unclassified Seohaeicola TaxID=2641111 RepID=UPI00237C3D5B|nr:MULTISPECIES: hypothetical protein [unclassified Seohaeicola]MDD9706953.1 hypothetical protein [Seohaeicola sp. 4SK31]MDD9735189.1 hypothetical protein [Seohaeicola sp. SP36]